MVEALDLKCLLGEFREYYNVSCNFNRIINASLGIAEWNLEHNKFEIAKQWYDRVTGYIEVVKACEVIREKELAIIPRGRLHDGDIVREVDAIIKGYLSRLA
jgi:hypothetical protein